MKGRGWNPVLKHLYQLLPDPQSSSSVRVDQSGKVGPELTELWPANNRREPPSAAPEDQPQVAPPV